jgi:hypothetical protein
MEPETLYPTKFAIYDPIKKCGEISEYGVLRRKFENVDCGFFSITKPRGSRYASCVFRTSLTHQGVSRTTFNSRFIDDVILRGELIAGTRLTRGDLAQLARSSTKLHIEIQDLGHAKDGYLIACNASHLDEEGSFEQREAGARSLPGFIGFFMDDDGAVGVVVGRSARRLSRSNCGGARAFGR